MSSTLFADCVVLVAPDRVWSRSEVLSKPSPVPKSRGVYAWYFRDFLPASVTADCIRFGELRLLYVGISPSAPPTNGKAPSKQSLWHRIRYHYRGNAEGSTLRLSLGCLLLPTLGIELRHVGTGPRLTFADGEERLCRWMQDNAFVTWMECHEPWAMEHHLISSLCLPLNLDRNDSSPFHSTLSEQRRAAKTRARELPVRS